MNQNYMTQEEVLNDSLVNATIEAEADNIEAATMLTELADNDVIDEELLTEEGIAQQSDLFRTILNKK
nr:MAG TPA: hypothetical protein [Caudoviricetes sp.]